MSKTLADRIAAVATVFQLAGFPPDEVQYQALVWISEIVRVRDGFDTFTPDSNQIDEAVTSIKRDEAEHLVRVRTAFSRLN